ncbi:hypothetical protein OIN60_00535 [Paenibacillus sp. P96]|uniref:Uncharacterized protein n=1 Tax=Paenibacillus zeirhizosphaerae TaxID=2987519 RepID=A0ABT9FKM1_9BACL|nr:hypothetical protein [Paenibacillus sp. P96]MDP4095278.1 hypothetical protein [Paenibacillus sp. P96]
MQNIMFIGACDKGGLLLWLGKVLASAGEKVLVIDATVLQKYQFAIPEISAGEVQSNKVIEFDGFDVATGFEHSFKEGISIHESLESYFHRNNEHYTSYDYVFIDVDHTEALEASLLASWGSISRYALVTNGERYTIQRNAELLQKLLQDQQKDGLQMVRIRYPAADPPVSEAFMEASMEQLNVVFPDEQDLELYYDEMDYIAWVRMQYESRLKLRGLSRSTKKILLSVLAAITDLERSSLRLALKAAERGR